MVQFGVLGTGFIATKFSEAAQVTDSLLYGVASRSLEKSELFRKKYDFVKAYGSYEELLEDPNIDCVYIALPHGMHFEWLNKCIDHKKNVLCEKSFTLNHKEAEIIYKRAQENGLFIMEAMWTRFLPTIQEVKKAINQGEIGMITKIEANFGFHKGQTISERLLNPVLGGGALLDIGIYPITLANLILGAPLKIQSKAVFHDTGIDLSNQIVYHYANAVAYLDSSFVEDISTDAYIYGTKGMIKIPGFFATEEALVFDDRGVLQREIVHRHKKNGMEYEINEVIHCLQENLISSKVMSPSTSIEILRQMDEIRQSWNLKYPGELQ